MDDLHRQSALEIHRLLYRGEVRPTEVAEHYLCRIVEGGARVGAFAHVDPDAALARAAAVEREVPRAAPLWGMPLADKDLQHRAGMPVRSGSRAFADQVATGSDELVRALDTAGAVSLGKTATQSSDSPHTPKGPQCPRRAHPGISPAERGDRAAARPPQCRRDCCRSRRAPTVVGRSGFRQHPAVWSV